MDRPLSLSALCEVMCADQKLFGTVTQITTDSRKITPGCMFIALRGERFDGHDFVAAALEQGAACAVAERDGDWPAGRVLRVGSTEKALRRAASLYREQLSARVVAVTGSVGKTSTRDMTAAALSAAWETCKTQGNLNNQVGVPQTVLGIPSSCGAAVVEMGMDGFGEIEESSLCARPDAAIITNIGVSHMEKLGSREGIFRAKTEIVAGLRPGAPLLLNGDDEFLRTYQNGRFRVIFYGIDHPACGLRAKNIQSDGQETRFDLCWENRAIPAVIPALGRHNVLNALAGFGAAVLLGADPEAAARALGGFSSTGMRQKRMECGGFTVVEDCYNASPDSFAAAIRTLGEMPCTGRRILVAADMLELGPIEREAHHRVGALSGEAGIDAVYTYGERARDTDRGAGESGVREHRHFESKEALAEQLIRMARAGDVLWFKGSRGMKLEDVLEKVYGECRK